MKNEKLSAKFINVINRYMKKIVSVLFMAILALNVHAQNYTYRSLSEIKDTTQFLYQNFVLQKSYFIGKPFSVLLEAYKKDLRVGYVAFTVTSSWDDPSGNHNNYINGVDLYWVDEYRLEYLFDHDMDELTTFRAVFKAPYIKEEHAFYNTVPDSVETALDKANVLKDFIVDDIMMLGKYDYPK